MIYLVYLITDQDLTLYLLLVIDQFEELFTQCNPAIGSSKACSTAARDLIAGVADLVQSGGGEIRVEIRGQSLNSELYLPLVALFPID